MYRFDTEPLSAAMLARQVNPLFAQALGRGTTYLATHSLGLPPDQATGDLGEYLATWREQGSSAWPLWLAEREAFRAALARLLGAPRPDLVVPRESAGAALATVLGTLPHGARVLASDSEFDSILTVLTQHAAWGRIQLALLPAHPLAQLHQRLAAELARTPTALVVCSHVFFATGQLLPQPAALAALCHQHGAAFLLDCYHSLGALPVQVGELACDYAIGGCYKYLRGGPGAAFLYVAPHRLTTPPPPDSGWFALEPGKAPSNLWAGPSGPLHFAPGGDAYLGATPAVAAWYAARSGLALTEALGAERLRTWSLAQLTTLREALAAYGIGSQGGDPEHGAFLAIPLEHAEQAVSALAEQDIVATARRGSLRLTPDILTTPQDLTRTAEALAHILRSG